jgi:phosphonopyruvate decarboxylase
MGVGSLGTIGARQPKNLTVVVLDNGHFGETGMQRSHTSMGTDLVAVAKGFGIDDSSSTASVDDCAAIARRVNSRQRAGLRAGLHRGETNRRGHYRHATVPSSRTVSRAALGLKPF